jgi:glyoxylase-like metal-dependent hydrolase (beta-lactamase superfamily II)
VDTGLEDFVTPPEFTAETGLTAKPLDEILEEQGLTPDDVDVVINTHLHDDHCGNNLMFPKAKFYIQAAELESCRNPHPLDYRYDDAYIEDLDIVPVEGDLEPLPGIKLISTPGHTPGNQTVQVETASGKVVIPGYCCCRLNFPETSPALPSGVLANAYQAYDNAQRVKAMDGCILPLHELDIAGKTF